MQKSLEQIQKENRKFILEANYGTFEEALNNTNISIYIKGNYSFLPLTLSRVLLAIYKHEYYEAILFDHSFVCLKGVSFDLTKETLEEQTEETQRAINEFFNN